ncbi:GNAT family N-acetyltransferase [Clostridiisalibacter paucivorans]|uniref:GNAT family N-acetyltransferase n=1 Tax=Clostridiisalibacter paucivorans TaxID=408753 RepID=UPI00047E6CE3|nr:GNAT family N-acetyltransferase [Clostridiisalibacter paucivorans]
MIIAKKVETKKELDYVKLFLVKNDELFNICKTDIVFIMEDNNQIIGAAICNIETQNYTRGLLKLLFIAKNKRNKRYGDGLLRALLNYCDIHGIKDIYFEEIDEYLINFGFFPIDSLNSNNTLYLNTEKFFSQKCCNRES